MLSSSDYNIVLGDKALLQLLAYIEQGQYSQILVLVDENTKTACLPILTKVLSSLPLSVIEIQAGESHKNLDSCQLIWTAMLANNADRKSLLINLGGGVIGDMGGFCAATFKRGMDFIQVPTTLLAQVDASVGAKLGIDFMRIKNGIGLFQPPKLVCIYPHFLNTLDKRELYSGFAEVIKHALIADIKYWERLLKIKKLEANQFDWASIIQHSVELKKSVVEADPLEKGLRKILNFGHTVGHAIESLSWETDQALLHGEAIAIGMICEAFLSHKILGLSAASLEIIRDYILGLYPKYAIEQLALQTILALMRQDKKNEGGQISFSLLSTIGQAEINIHCSDAMIEESLQYYSDSTKVEQ